MMGSFVQLEKHGGSVALVDEAGRSVTYGELAQNADELGARLSGRSLVFLLCENNVESLTGYLGFLRARAVPFLISKNTRIDLFQSLLDKYKPEYIWYNSSLSLRISSGVREFSLNDYILVKTNYVIDYNIHDDLALLLSTSGSTGSPKLVKLSYRNLSSNASSIAKYLAISPKSKPITSLPMNYTFGLSVLNSHLLVGATIVLTDRSLVDKGFWSLLKREQVTTFSGVPYTYEILKRLNFARMNLPSLRQLTQAGGKLSISLSREFAEICAQKGIEFFVMYGQTEATARMSYLHPKYSISKAGSIGVAIPGGEFTLMDDDGHIITQSEREGELVYKGENVSMGYADSCYDLGKGDENCGVLRTGDIAKRDNDGFYHIVGRKKRFVKIFGNRINLDEVEQLLKEGGHDCVCAGEDDKLRVYTTVADKTKEIERYLIDHTEINPSGFSVHYIEKIPRNEYGRITYSLLT